jgi:hypothetical protein
MTAKSIRITRAPFSSSGVGGERYKADYVWIAEVDDPLSRLFWRGSLRWKSNIRFDHMPQFQLDTAF